MIDSLKVKHPLQMLCQQLNVSVSGYLAHQHTPVSGRKQRDQRFITHIRAAHVRGRGSYGPNKIQTELVEQSNIYLGINSIKRLRKIAGIRCKQKRKFRVTTDSKHKLPVVPNLLNRQFNPSSPNQVWVADITYIPTDEGWLYLAAVKDLHTCEVVGWAMDERMTKTLVCDALRAAYWRKKPAPGLMHHSDRGSQYCSKAYRALQASYKMQTSMSNKGDCWDNAPMESFFGTLKTECLHHYKFKTREEAKRVTFEYIEVFYNQIRRHAKLNNQAPAQFAKNYHQNLKKNAA